jgi:predicted nuclease of restriction endonuclease-like (RecB) superfamily
LALGDLAAQFPLPWSAYVRLLSVKNEQARKFYEAEALRELERATARSPDQLAVLRPHRAFAEQSKDACQSRGLKTRRCDHAGRRIKDPYVLEFLGLKDEYSESEIEEALILHLERFLLELGGDFAFIGRQRRLRIGDEWYRIDLLFFHRKLRCLVVIDLKRGRFTHADAGQMHMYLNYAREHWTHEGENPPVGLILCSQKDEAIARYALDGLPNKILATEYRTVLPDEQLIADEIEKTRQQLEARRSITR